MKRDFNKEELQAAMDMIANGKCPSWMNSIEKQAYALGVITDEDIIPHERCRGRGWLPSTCPVADDACSCPGSTGVVISGEGKALIKVQFPEYKLRSRSTLRGEAEL